MQDDIYSHPDVKPLWDEYTRRTTLADKNEVLPQLLAAMGEVQKQRADGTP